ncbi:caspase domain-containing protein [Rhodocollybia butyracea]|uniref:Caspase domain-containing protein n=1 Tax=Rhodocollybia butyracea TaxID=206335 RepID=A0A9P5TY85_9AGAR|nr:caspase domain-containing protein [Rhodocollybia butyracea]
MKKNSLVDRLFGSNCNYKCDVPPQRVLPDVLENAKSNGRRYHAVIVGINEYGDPTTPSLNGCVNDALLFRDYLIQDLSVPSNRIKLLLSPIAGDKTIPFPYKAPTRDNILQALCDLFHNPDIKHDDSIIFFYAGHGQSYREACCTPEPAGSIEAICPVDRNTRKINADGTEETILDICDREINVILGEIATKCPNITVILDCCFGGGGTRNGVPDSDLASLQLGDKESFMSRHCHPIPSAVPSCSKLRMRVDVYRQTDPTPRPKLSCQHEITRIDCFR